MRYITTYLALVLFLASCNEVPLKDISSRIKDGEGFSDIFLTIVSDTKTDSTHIFIAKGLYKNKTVGLQFEVKSAINAGIIDGKVSQGGFAANGVCLKSIGQESDELIKAMSELYKIPTTKRFTQKAILTTAFSLNEKTADLDKKDDYNFKLFFEEGSETLYSEIFFNLKLKKGEIELFEKDEAYREALVKVWSN